MAVILTAEYVCDSCGRKPDPADKLDSDRWGWYEVFAYPRSVSGKPGGRDHPAATIICSQCREKFPLFFRKKEG